MLADQWDDARMAASLKAGSSFSVLLARYCSLLRLAVVAAYLVANQSQARIRSKAGFECPTFWDVIEVVKFN